jgi:hypothetical protein
MDKNTDVETLTQYITDEIFKVFKAAPDSWIRRTFGPMFRLPAHRFARLANTFDHYVEQYGLREAAQRVLPAFARTYDAQNVESVPQDGPLLITSNHPGTCDSLVIAANIPRPDLKIIVTGRPFMRGMHNSARNLIYTSLDVYEQMSVLRAAIRHLQGGGAVLIFPTGSIDPDPALSPDAPQELQRWSPSLEVMLRHAPQTRVLLTIVSGVLSSGWRRNPLIRLAGDEFKQRQVAEFLQVIQQMIFPNSVNVNPHLTFSNPLTTEELTQKGQRMMDAMIERARCLMEDHMARVGTLLPVRT